MMKRLVLGGDWAARRMKAMRFHLIALAGARAPRAPADRATFGRRSRPDPRRARRHPFPATGVERMIARLLPPVLQTPPGSAGHGVAVTAGSGGTRQRCRRAVTYNHSASMLASYPALFPAVCKR